MTWQIFLDRVTVFVKVTQPVNPNDYELFTNNNISYHCDSQRNCEHEVVLTQSLIGLLICLHAVGQKLWFEVLKLTSLLSI